MAVKFPIEWLSNGDYTALKSLTEICIILESSYHKEDV